MSGHKAARQNINCVGTSSLKLNLTDRREKQRQNRVGGTHKSSRENAYYPLRTCIMIFPGPYPLKGRDACQYHGPGDQGFAYGPLEDTLHPNDSIWHFWLLRLSSTTLPVVCCDLLLGPGGAKVRSPGPPLIW